MQRSHSRALDVVFDPFNDSEDYFRYVLAKLDRAPCEDQYYPPIQVVLGSMDPVVDMGKTRQAMKQLIHRHSEGDDRFFIHERSDFSHMWGHQSAVSTVYDTIIHRIEKHSDWD